MSGKSQAANDGGESDSSDQRGIFPTTLEESQDKLSTIIGKAKAYFAS